MCAFVFHSLSLILLFLFRESRKCNANEQHTSNSAYMYSTQASHNTTAETTAREKLQANLSWLIDKIINIRL